MIKIDSINNKNSIEESLNKLRLGNNSLKKVVNNNSNSNKINNNYKYDNSSIYLKNNNLPLTFKMKKHQNSDVLINNKNNK